MSEVEVVCAPVWAGLEVEQGQSFLEVLTREFEIVLKNDEVIKELLKKKASQGKSWTIVLRASFYQTNNKLDAVLHIQHIFSTDETEWAYLLHAFNVKGDVVIEDYARKRMRDFSNKESKLEHSNYVIDFNIRAFLLFKNILRKLSVLNWSNGEGRSKKEVRIVLSNIAELAKVREVE